MARSSPVVPKPAATVVLLRHEGGRREVFLTKRPDSMAFLAGYYVFPGGSVDAVDRRPEATGRLFGADLSAMEQSARDGHDPAAFFTASVRELFEESGVLMLCDARGEIVSDEVYRDMRDGTKPRGRGFVRELVGRNLFYAGHRLTLMQLFTTPAFSPIRFYTVFFRADLPDGQRAGMNSPEVECSLWVTPEEALERNRSGEFPMILPTLAALYAIINASQ